MSLRSALACLAFAAASAVSFASSASAGSIPLAASGKVVTETREATGFSGVRLALPGTVVLRQAGTHAVSVEADDNLLPEIETVVEKDSLVIRFRRGVSVTGRSTLRLLVTAPAFSALAISGSGEILAESLKSPQLSISIAGNGDARIARLETGSLTAAIAGSGDVKVAGRADDVTVKIAGSGDVVAGSLDAKRAKVSVSGSGDAELMVRENLSVSIAGSGDVRYHGDPEVTRKVAGSGSVKRLGPAP